MIDVIVINDKENSDISKTIFSICLQNIKDKVKVTIIDKFDNDEIKKNISLFSGRLSIEYVCSKNDENLFQTGLNKTKGKYLFFIKSGDVLYDAFSLSGLYNYIEEKKCTIVYGSCLFKKQNDLELIEDNNNICGKLVKRKSIEKLSFNYIYEYSDIFFYNLITSLFADCFYLDDPVLVIDENDFSLSGLKYDLFNEYLLNLLWFIECSEENNGDKDYISYVILNSIMLIYNLYNLNYFVTDSSKIVNESYDLYLYYKKYCLDYDKEEFNKIYFNNILNVPVISIYDFLGLIAKQELYFN